jgi:hypothetical protein
MVGFANFPDETVSSVVWPWLTIVDVAYLDNAYCNIVLRDRFVITFRKSGVTIAYPVKTNRESKYHDAMNEWILRRGVPVDGMFASRSFLRNHDARKMYLQEHGYAMRWVEYALTGSNNPQRERAALDVAQYCPGLVRISVADRIDAAYGEEIASCFPLLEELQTSRCTDEGLAELGKGCKKVQRVKLACFPDDLSEEALIAFVRNFPYLRSFSTTSGNVTDAVVQELASSCTGLAELEITFSFLRDASVFALMERCKDLSRLQLRNCELEPSPHQAVARESMRELVVWRSAMSDAQLSYLLRACPGLTSLTVRDCQHIRSIPSWHIGARCPLLRRLSIEDNSSSVNDDALLEVSEHCADLRALKVAGSPAVTDAGLSAIAEKCRFLEEVDIRGCEEVTGEFLSVLAQNGRSLRVLRLDDCAKVTDAAVKTVLSTWPHL